MSRLIIRNARVLTMLKAGERHPPAGGRRGADLSELGTLPHADVLIEGEHVVRVAVEGLNEPIASSNGSLEVDARGQVLMPGFVDCHTHTCWGGGEMVRANEWEMKLAGKSYQEIAAAGGGIMSSVRATRETSIGELACDLLGRVDRMVQLGTTTIEVKSGYGLVAEQELKMLDAIIYANQYSASQLVPTALLGHALDPDAPGANGSTARFVDQTIAETLPLITKSYSGVAIDAFCEQGAWTLDDTVRLLSAAQALGHPVRVHADQFTSMGMVRKAVAMGARSVDHLEASTEDDLRVLGQSETFCVGLPVCGFHLDGRYAKLGQLAAMGGKVCIATNFNPGSAPCPSMAFAIALAVRHCGLSVAQAIVAATLNPAVLLGFGDRGYIAPGARADLLLLRESDERVLAYEVGDNPVASVIVGGELLG